MICKIEYMFKNDGTTLQKLALKFLAKLSGSFYWSTLYMTVCLRFARGPATLRPRADSSSEIRCSYPGWSSSSLNSWPVLAIEACDLLRSLLSIASLWCRRTVFRRSCLLLGQSPWTIRSVTVFINRWSFTNKWTPNKFNVLCFIKSTGLVVLLYLLLLTPSFRTFL